MLVSHLNLVTLPWIGEGVCKYYIWTKCCGFKKNPSLLPSFLGSFFPSSFHYFLLPEEENKKKKTKRKTTPDLCLSVGQSLVEIPIFLEESGTIRAWRCHSLWIAGHWIAASGSKLRRPLWTGTRCAVLRVSDECICSAWRRLYDEHPRGSGISPLVFPTGRMPSSVSNHKTTLGASPQSFWWN